MFEWKVEDMALRSTERQEIPFHGINRKIFPFEKDVSREDKIEFVDRMNDGKLSYILTLAEKWKADKVDLPKTKWGDIHANSIKKWKRENDPRDILFSDSVVYYFLGFEGSLNTDKTGFYSCWDDVVDELFHRQLMECLNSENAYFREHDEYEILKTKLREYSNRHNTNFGVYLSFSGGCGGKICVCKNSTDYKTDREITIEELKILIDKYERLEAYIAELTAETDITY